MQARLLALVFMLSTGALACSGSDDQGSSNGAGNGNGNGNGNGGGNGSSNGAGSGDCLDPATFDYVVPLHRGDDTYWLAYHADVDGSKIFYGSIDALHSLDTTNGAFTELYKDPGAIVVHSFVRADDVVVVKNKKVFSVPKSGGAPTSLPDFGEQPLSSFAGTIDVAIDGNVAFAKAVVHDADTDTDEVRYFTHDLPSGAETVLGTESRAKDSSFILGSDALYSYYADSDDPGSPTTVFKIGRSGGGPATLSFTPGGTPLFPLGFQGANLLLYQYSQADFSGAILRAAATGGPVTSLGETPYALTFKGQATTFPAEGGQVVQVVNELYFLADGSSEVTRIACIDGDFTLHGSAAVGKTIYANVVDSAQGGGVIRIPIP